jgi:hypothetical protein
MAARRKNRPAGLVGSSRIRESTVRGATTMRVSTRKETGTDDRVEE